MKVNNPFLRLVPTFNEDGSLRYNSQDLIRFNLQLWDTGKLVDKAAVVSGQPSKRQILNRARDRRPGSMQPIGEAVYRLGDPDATRGVNWASGKVGDYSGSFGPGLGPVWVGIHPVAGNVYGLKSFDLGLHEDENEYYRQNPELYSPGTSGCVGVQHRVPGDNTRLVDVVTWFQEYTLKYLLVDMGFGTVPTAEEFYKQLLAGKRP